MTYDQAIAAITELDVARWGQQEREAAERLNRKNYPSIGLALNHLAYYDPDNPNLALAAEARALMTSADWRILKSGG